MIAPLVVGRVLASDGRGPSTTLRVGEFKIEGWPRRFDPPQPQVEITASFNSQARLVGLDADTTQVAPGDTINTRLYWQAQAEFQQNYTMFVHLIGPDGLLYGQVDHIPGAGAYPTTGWLPGEYIADEYAIPVAQNAPPGDYQLIVGLYDPDTGQRLTIGEERCQGVTCSQGDNAVKLLGLTVK